MNTRIQLVAFWTLLRRELVRMFRLWQQTFLPPVIMQSLYFVVFGSFIGSQIPPIHGLRYMTYIVPGLIMMALITSSFMNVVFSLFSAKFMRSIEEMLIAPVENSTILAGYVAGGVARALITGVLVAVVSIFFAQPPIVHIFAILFFAIVTSIVFSLGGFLNALFAKSFDDAGLFSTFVLTPLIYLGGVFYSVSTLPAWAHSATLLNPIFYLVNGFRYGFLGFADVSVYLCLAVLMAFVLVLGGVNWYFIKTGLGLKQ